MEDIPKFDIHDYHSEATWRDLDAAAAVECVQYDEQSLATPLSAYPLPGYEQLDDLTENIDHSKQSPVEGEQNKLPEQDTLRTIYIKSGEGTITLNFAMNEDGLLRWLGESACADNEAEPKAKGIDMKVLPLTQSMLSHFACDFVGTAELCKRQIDELVAHLAELRRQVNQMPGIDRSPEQQREQLALLQHQLKCKRELIRRLKDMRF